MSRNSHHYFLKFSDTVATLCDGPKFKKNNHSVGTILSKDLTTVSETNKNRDATRSPQLLATLFGSVVVALLQLALSHRLITVVETTVLHCCCHSVTAILTRSWHHSLVPVLKSPVQTVLHSLC